MRNGELSVRERVSSASRWFTNGFLAVVAGYGEKPQRVIGTGLAVVGTWSLLYPLPFVGGVSTGDGLYVYGTQSDLVAELMTFAYNSLYFSVVTFTTLGYGDISPAGGLARLLASTEAASGAFLTALFVFTLGRRVIR